MPREKSAIAILGPTASGKSRLAIELALQFRGEIVSCDALQVYRHMHVGTAKMLPHERRGIPHHLLDIRDPGQDFTAGDYQRLAREVIAKIHERKHVPFVVGGTGFYLKALIEGLFDGPARSEEHRSRMRKILQRKGPGFLHRLLRRFDPESAARIAEADFERTIRACEVYLATGKPMSWWRRQPRDALKGYRWLKIGLSIPREQLYRRINQRAEEMFRTGLLDEVKQLLEISPQGSHALKAIGYRQAAEHLQGRFTLQEAIEETKKQSRHYAKRQLTWFRADPDIIWLSEQPNSDELRIEAADLIEEFLRE